MRLTKFAALLLLLSTAPVTIPLERATAQGALTPPPNAQGAPPPPPQGVPLPLPQGAPLPSTQGALPTPAEAAPAPPPAISAPAAPRSAAKRHPTHDREVMRGGPGLRLPHTASRPPGPTRIRRTAARRPDTTRLRQTACRRPRTTRLPHTSCRQPGTTRLQPTVITTAMVLITVTDRIGLGGAVTGGGGDITYTPHR